MKRLNWVLGAVLTLAGVSMVWAEAPAATRPASVVPAPKDLPRHEQNLKRIAEGPIGAVFFGDSITDGWHGAADVWKRAFGQYEPANFGISGDRTQHVLWRMLNGELDGYHPKVIVLMIGTNNMGDAADDIVQGVQAIVQTARQKQPQAKILLLAIFPRQHEPGELRHKVQQVNDKLEKLADGENVRFLDIASHFISEDGTISSEIMPDYLHLSHKGYEIWAEAMGPVLAEMMKP